MNKQSLSLCLSSAKRCVLSACGDLTWKEGTRLNEEEFSEGSKRSLRQITAGEAPNILVLVFIQYRSRRASGNYTHVVVFFLGGIPVLMFLFTAEKHK